MKTTTQAVGLSFMLVLCLVWPAPSSANPSLPHEPGEELLVEQTYDTVIGLLIREYSLKNNGQVDYRTARHILGISYDDPASEALEVASHPFLYWYDANQDGQWEMWIDREEAGQLANAARYDWRQGEDLITSSKTW